MPDRTRERRDAPRPPTVLDPVRPAVVRRRIVDPATFNTSNANAREDEAGPPSSVNVARALASLRADELRRVETLVSMDDDDDDGEPSSLLSRPNASTRSAPSSTGDSDDDEPPPTALSPGSTPPPAAAPPSQPTVLVGSSIVLSALAAQMGKRAEDLVGTLVASGFYSLHAKSNLPKETATTIANMFGFRVEDAPPSEPKSAKTPRSSKRAAKPASKKREATKKSAKKAPSSRR
jgi:hypothetical protein